MVEIIDIKVLLLQYLFSPKADLPRAEFLGGRFSDGRFGKGRNCPSPIASISVPVCYILRCVHLFGIFLDPSRNM